MPRLDGPSGPIRRAGKFVVYEPSKKALKKNSGLFEGDRLIFLGNGSAALWNGDRLKQADLFFSKPDCNVCETQEAVPSMLRCSAFEHRHIEKNGITLPFSLSIIELG